ncbi:hypothetical protein C8Q79DRAFT_942261 [Trametes meyenii]|nr:hypothetical protein C8Q79DRAFT_942261 [Trametes meyenii]
MPPKPEPFMTIPNYEKVFSSLTKKWTDIFENDPRRVCRLLLLNEFDGETLEGDAHNELGYAYIELKKLSRKSTSRTWKNLVDAGIITSLCKFAINQQHYVTFVMPDMTHDGKAELSQEAMERMRDNAPSPYIVALEVLCNAVCSCAIPPTSTERKTIDELKKHWSTIMQRVWSEPRETLEPGEGKGRVMERLVVGQIVHRVVRVDPTFLDVVLKPSDLTLAVSFRFWLYSTDEPDARSNSSLISPFLPESMVQDHWAGHFASSPPPDIHTLLPRILLGASRGVEKKKRTPTQQADFIVSTFASHWQRFPPRYILEEFELFASLLKATSTEWPPFARAVHRSEPLWSSMAGIMKRYGAVDRNASLRGFLPEGAAVAALRMYFNVLNGPEGDEHVDTLTYSWLAGGLFDGLEGALGTIVRSARGPILLSSLFSALCNHLPKLSAKTMRKLRLELPRPRIMLPLIYLANDGNQDPAALLKLVTDGNRVLQSPYSVRDPRHPIWSITAWQMLLKLTNTARPWREVCARRGCENTADGAVCPECDIAPYCGQECLNKWVLRYLQVHKYGL